MIGRPTKYNDEMQKKADEYLINCPNVLPSHAGLAVYLGIHLDTVYDWVKKFPKFSESTKEIKTHQHMKLIDGGLSGEMNAPITKLLLATHGYSDKQEIKQETNLNLSGMTDDQLKKIIDESR